MNRFGCRCHYKRISNLHSHTSSLYAQDEVQNANLSLLHHTSTFDNLDQIIDEQVDR